MKIKKFKTNLGEISLNSFSNEKAEIEITDFGYTYKSESYEIKIIEFNEIKDWLKDASGVKIEKSIGFIFQIIKLNNKKENLKFKCILENNDSKATSEPDTGEHLLAIWIDDNKNVVSIGTEDGEAMKYRAEENDWIPNRFKSELGIIKVWGKYKEKSFTEIIDFGLETEIPYLKKGEKFYFHYLIATNELKKSIDYPDEFDISTNFAVDFPKRTLIE
jgi:hypothetical protein